MKKLKFKKPEIGAPIGTEVDFNGECYSYTNTAGKEVAYTVGFFRDNNENPSDWFEEVQEPKWTDADMARFAQWWFHNGSLCNIEKSIKEWEALNSTTTDERSVATTDK